MKISIITINYNNCEGLERTIKSILEQEALEEVELIIIDGGSKDESIEIIKKNSAKINYWISEPDKGIYDAMNKGILVASGEYLQFMNSGDVFYKNEVINLEIENINNYPNVDIFYGDVMFLFNNQETPLHIKQPSEINLAFFKNQNINHQASIIKRELFKNSLFKTEFKLSCDYIKFLDLCIEGKCFKHIKTILAGYDFNGLSSTAEGLKLYRKEMMEYWNKSVPKGMDELIDDYLNIKPHLSSALVKKSIRVDNFICSIKNKIHNAKTAFIYHTKSLIGISSFRRLK